MVKRYYNKIEAAYARSTPRKRIQKKFLRFAVWFNFTTIINMILRSEESSGASCPGPWRPQRD